MRWSVYGKKSNMQSVWYNLPVVSTSNQSLKALFMVCHVSQTVKTHNMPYFTFRRLYARIHTSAATEQKQNCSIIISGNHGRYTRIAKRSIKPTWNLLVCQLRLLKYMSDPKQSEPEPDVWVFMIRNEYLKRVHFKSKSLEITPYRY